MKKLIFTLLFSTLVFSSTSYAEWKLVAENMKAKYYVDKIKKIDGYVYWWLLADYFKPMDSRGILTMKVYHQADCKLFRLRGLSFYIYKEQMGRGLVNDSWSSDEDWHYAPPDSSLETVLNYVCTSLTSNQPETLHLPT
jgi:hypothetical protein